MKNKEKKLNKIKPSKKDIKKPKKIKHKKTHKKHKSLNIFKVNGEFKLIPLIINILIPVVSGFIVGYLNKNSMTTYETLKKPFFNPPAIVFPIVWSILYILMGIAAYRIYMRNKQGIDDKGAYFFYLVQLIFNLMWSFIFFTFRLYAISFFWIIILFVLVIITFIKFIKVDKIAAILLTPYMLWLVFAGVLNYFIWLLNEM
ncbi:MULTISPECIES: TspO/MBR family protein [Clostridium]|uniref:TspO/MBR family protein n=1 Tax=Clostridium TaxID=1485 RepID=UPI001A9C0EDF|nr:MULTISPECIES: TspO/MBR family protein [Clostridium]MCR1949497.1 tryptophan-rich sensory protein [Clostridium sp. DSM 100503]MDI9216384.1 tryptophan-rich sensory protein [Clostridium tertium]